MTKPLSVNAVIKLSLVNMFFNHLFVTIYFLLLHSSSCFYTSVLHVVYCNSLHIGSDERTECINLENRRLNIKNLDVSEYVLSGRFVQVL